MIPFGGYRIRRSNFRVGCKYCEWWSRGYKGSFRFLAYAENKLHVWKCHWGLHMSSK